MNKFNIGDIVFTTYPVSPNSSHKKMWSFTIAQIKRNIYKDDDRIFYSAEDASNNSTGSHWVPECALFRTREEAVKDEAEWELRGARADLARARARIEELTKRPWWSLS